jgi:hypothetical protein
VCVKKREREKQLSIESSPSFFESKKKRKKRNESDLRSTKYHQESESV